MTHNCQSTRVGVMTVVISSFNSNFKNGCTPFSGNDLGLRNSDHFLTVSGYQGAGFRLSGVALAFVTRESTLRASKT